MTRTVLSSAKREVVIGFDEPFVIIGERINPTGRKKLAEEMKAGDYSGVERDAVAQVAAGAHLLDVNAGIPLADEPKILAECVALVQGLVDVPLSIDSSMRRLSLSQALPYASISFFVPNQRAPGNSGSMSAGSLLTKSLMFPTGGGS